MNITVEKMKYEGMERGISRGIGD
ncbi:uncharacterized protein G2W53_026314 [Senna tora]|uniref:Uncharacterized protein n=1 Tax=Senna tora TaxID=362788 RepID=A0A834TNP3_9FABA|nr:uncharacterized protein G2W53_026314 [Senna tora]